MARLLLILIGHLVGASYGQAPVIPPNGTLSAYAMKLQGVCAKASDLEHFRSKCTASSTTIWPKKLPNPKPEVPEQHYIKVKRQNQIMLAELINWGFNNSTVPEQEPKFGFELLSAIYGTFGKVCPDVPTTFLQKAYHLLTHLHWKTAVDRVDYLPRKYQRWITRLFNNCTSSVEPLEYLTDSCKETVIAVDNCTDYICTQPKYEFRLMKADPIIDIAFKAFEVIQSLCFPYFEESIRMFHYFHLAVMDVFTDDLKIRWMTQLENAHWWKHLLGPNFQSFLINIEKCTEAAISRSSFKFRIPRESVPARIRLTGVRREFG